MQWAFYLQTTVAVQKLSEEPKSKDWCTLSFFSSQESDVEASSLSFVVENERRSRKRLNFVSFSVLIFATLRLHLLLYVQGTRGKNLNGKI